MTDIKNVVFDLGGVLVDWNPRYLYNKIFDRPDKVEAFLSNVCTFEWNAQQDAGRPLVEATKTLLEQHPDWSNEIKAYYERWTEMLNGPILGTLQILRSLKSKNNLRLLALTNWSGETFPTAMEMFDFLHWFEGIVVSGDEGLIKPDPRIYQVLFDRFQIEPSESLFIDDSAPNVNAAVQQGMHGIHFKSPEQLNQELSRLAVL